MIILAIDGASRRNGKPNCSSLGATFVFDTEKELGSVATILEDTGSTNQRGEIGALQVALEIGNTLSEDLFLVTDSEYVFNTVSKKWFDNWDRKNWIIENWETKEPQPVKNRDLWEGVRNAVHYIESTEKDIVVYHVKGHLLKTNKGMLRHFKNSTGMPQLYSELEMAWDSYCGNGNSNYPLDKALNLFESYHNFKPDLDVFKKLVICNTIADLAAGYYLDKAESEREIPF